MGEVIELEQRRRKRNVTHKVVLRTKWEIRPEAKQLDGKVFRFSFGWTIVGGKYDGEDAMIPDYESWPDDAPSWVASGDLERYTDG